ncbi:Catechol-2,3-dioxygenase [Marivirga sericea]|uniref:Catechol-2,3-dioxygenase n=1 Tax=Marivirga sericea TaxID=1028 RepID=A0A1X7JL43_9BACT|nr:hypothetical protein [Marivirga sericea]SMG28916.1 Catechol-2,3-dioxygenase [Marivirga sericea]
MNKSQKSRRNFLWKSALVLPSLHFGLLSFTSFSDTNLELVAANRIQRIELLTAADKMDLQKDFYVNRLHLPLIIESGNSFEVLAGNTIIKFILTSTHSPFYHFAFNIPENKIQKAIDWSTERFQLIKNGKGEKVIHFKNWDAHAIYFFDPAGNILEFIAHHTLSNSAKNDFKPEDILNICEIGLVSNNVLALASEIELKTGLTDYKSGFQKSSDFRAIGDPNGMLILSRENRNWLMTDKPAVENMVSVNLLGEREGSINLQNTTCNINMKRQ